MGRPLVTESDDRSGVRGRFSKGGGMITTGGERRAGGGGGPLAAAETALALVPSASVSGTF